MQQNPESAKAVLYLLSDMGIYTNDDFKKFLLEQKESELSPNTTNDYSSSLKSLFLINEAGSEQYPHFILKHEYFSIRIRSYLESEFMCFVSFIMVGYAALLLL